jgi:hypothetical protein
VQRFGHRAKAPHRHDAPAGLARGRSASTPASRPWRRRMLLAVSAKRSTRTRTWPSASAAGSVLRKVVVARRPGAQAGWWCSCTNGRASRPQAQARRAACATPPDGVALRTRDGVQAPQTTSLPSAALRRSMSMKGAARWRRVTVSRSGHRAPAAQRPRRRRFGLLRPGGVLLPARRPPGPQWLRGSARR